MCVKGSIESIDIEYGSVACRGLWCVCGWKDAEMALCKQFVLIFFLRREPPSVLFFNKSVCFHLFIYIVEL